MSNQTDHTIVRLRVPPELKKQIEEAAEYNNRSQSAEMVARLEKSFDTSIDSDLVKDIKITMLQNQLSESMKMMDILHGYFNSMLHGKQDEYMETVFSKYPTLKEIYESNDDLSKKTD
ncbi:Arc family DNA-binding protein [Acinetobacter sp. NIPH 2100]|uniref:Arc family DNA-binding protein n=1 Tax=Acinetobacter sp. NIPH 2100 TaxID=1217708 RepID=UPI0002CE4B70|nr:Arc family DNA-binding protein [Acinetobacter sp. NIPH 2100]ENX41530.1 hypothetical protein F887_01926 [Acinetobacter sp. NIPH 2100]